ncbi:MAG TPA: hypothetical protein VKQ30_03185 [Ktedonobacterales bacterium]|nr:hypothetical protein [Ktedonobacterales bacterium]
MGQKLSEHPATDWWVKLAREADATGVGAQLPTREVNITSDYGRWEMDRFADMQRLRFRSISRVERVMGGPPLADVLTCHCQRCGRPIGKRSTRKRLVRQVWRRDGSRQDFYICGRC